uniref:Uncharacterized protein n=1 Tax=Arundo donax TaxID=35708 RepID=A0A0A9HGV2_ARUDO
MPRATCVLWIYLTWISRCDALISHI